VRYSMEKVFEVVSNVQDYHLFLPWCRASKFLERGQSNKGSDSSHARAFAELEVGFKGFSERYTSEITMMRPKFIQVKAVDSTLFEILTSEWKFSSGPSPSSCWLEFQVDFRFRNELYNQVATTFQEEVTTRMIGAFEQRCRDLYGQSDDKEKR